MESLDRGGRKQFSVRNQVSLTLTCHALIDIKSVTGPVRERPYQRDLAIWGDLAGAVRADVRFHRLYTREN